MSAEGMVARYAPYIPGYIRNHYGWLSKRHCLYDVDDLTQIAMIELIKLSKTWELSGPLALQSRELRNKLFFYDLKGKVGEAIRSHRLRVEPGKYVEDSFDRDYDESGESILEPRTRVNQRTSTNDWPMILTDIVDQFSALPLGRKVILGLHYYDELRYDQISELLDRPRENLATDASKSRTAIRNFARNHFADHEVDVHQFREAAFEPSEALTAYIEGRHRMDIQEWMGVFTLALRSDPVYLNRMLDTDRRLVHGSTSRRRDTDLQQMIDVRLQSGMSISDVAEDLGMRYQKVWRYAQYASALD